MRPRMERKEAFRTFVGMKCRAVSLLALSVLLFGFVAVPGRLKRAFEALEVYNYFKAKDLFYRSLKRDSVAAAYGLATIYGRNDNPFFHPDSAFKFAGVAYRGYPGLDLKTKSGYAPFGVDSASVHSLTRRADSLVFATIVRDGDPAAYADFIHRARTDHFRSLAVAERDSVAYGIAHSASSAAALRAFMEEYPEAEQVPEAKKLYDQRLYHEKTASGSLAAYKKFIAEVPDSPYRRDAEYQIFQMSTTEETPESLIAFIRENPDNAYVEKAWTTLYLLEIGDMSASAIAAFSLKYPDFPDQERLKRDFDNATTRFYRYEENGMWGYIDEDGRVRIEPTFEWNEPFAEGIAVVGHGDKAGYIDKSGHLIAPVAFDEAYPFRNGYAVVEIRGKYGAINRAGDWAIEPEYEDLGEYGDGMFFASKGDGYGYLNEKGEVVIDFSYGDATDFEDSRAVVELDGKKVLIDAEGNVLSNGDFDWIERFPDEGLPARVRVDGRFGLIDRMGTLLVEPVYTGIGDFGDGLALATDGSNYGFIDVRGDTAIPFVYTYKAEALTKSRFADGYAPVFRNNDVGVIDTTGERIFPAIFEDVGRFEGKLIPVKKRGKWGYADLKVNLAIPYNYSWAGHFRDSVAIAAVKGKFGLIDTLGKTVLPFRFERLEFVDTLLLATDTAVGLIDTRGVEIVPMIFRTAEVLDGRVIRFIDEEGRPRYFDCRRKEFLRED